MNENYSLYNIVCAGLTDRGRIRAENQDAFFMLPEKGFFLVVDGLGGHQAGRHAAEMITNILPEQILQLSLTVSNGTKAIAAVLQEEIRRLNHILWQASESYENIRGMGATLVMAYSLQENVFIAHVGDSRAYLLRANQLNPLTKDHSIIRHLVDSGVITPDKADDHPMKNQITQCIGMEKDIAPDITSFITQAGDRILLCTDGLSEMLKDTEIAEILNSQKDSQLACQILIEMGNDRGGEDNMTVVIVDWI
ncbi:MAG: Stp1/IreP family PP2C-type Ser/Thr phosphatase [bacterium]